MSLARITITIALPFALAISEPATAQNATPHKGTDLGQELTSAPASSCIITGVSSWQIDTERKEIFRLCATGQKQQITCRQMQTDMATLDAMIDKLERVIKGEWPLAFFFQRDTVTNDYYAFAIPPERHQEMLEQFKRGRKSIEEADKKIGINAPLYGCPVVS